MGEAEEPYAAAAKADLSVVQMSFFEPKLERQVWSCARPTPIFIYHSLPTIGPRPRLPFAARDSCWPTGSKLCKRHSTSVCDGAPNPV